MRKTCCDWDSQKVTQRYVSRTEKQVCQYFLVNLKRAWPCYKDRSHGLRGTALSGNTNTWRLTVRGMSGRQVAEVDIERRLVSAWPKGESSNMQGTRTPRHCDIVFNSLDHRSCRRTRFAVLMRQSVYLLASKQNKHQKGNMKLSFKTILSGRSTATEDAVDCGVVVGLHSLPPRLRGVYSVSPLQFTCDYCLGVFVVWTT